MEVEFQVREKSFHSGESVTDITFDFSVINVRPKTNYKCVECALSFTTWSHFQRHKLMHSGVVSTNKPIKQGPAPVVKEGSLPQKETAPIVIPNETCIVIEKETTPVVIAKGTMPVVITKEKKLLPKTKESCNDNAGDIDKGVSAKKKVKKNGIKINDNDDDTHQCDQCDKKFPNSWTLKAHVTVHHLPYKCTSCDKAFAQQVQLTYHARCHGEKKHICEVCEKGFKRPYHLKRHMSTHNGDNNDKVKDKDNNDKGKDKDNNDKGKDKNGKKVKSKGSKNKNDNGDGNGDSNGDSNINGNEEKRQVDSNDDVKKISNLENGEGDNMDSSKDDIEKAEISEVSIHEKETNYYEVDNTEVVEQDQTNNDNMNLKNSVDNIEVVTQDEQNNNNDNMENSHNNTELEIQDGQNNDNNNNLENSENMEVEKQEQNNMKHSLYMKEKKWDSSNHRCNICDKSFSSGNGLRRHQLIHTGQKDFVCGVCEKTFSRREHLKRHLVTHSK